MANPYQGIPEESDSGNVPLDPALTKQLFRQWRSPRFGPSNPERMNNPVWEWLVRAPVTAFWLNRRMGGPSPFKAGPGWISGHTAELCADGQSILVRGGKTCTESPESAMPRNLDEWRLDLVHKRWVRLTHCAWQRWEVRRKDGELTRLPEAVLAEAAKAHGLPNPLTNFNEVLESVGVPPLDDEPEPPLNLEVAGSLFQPGLDHKPMPADPEQPWVTRIEVAGVLVRYDVDPGGIQVTIEGTLPQPTIDALIADLTDKLALLENSPCQATRL